MSERNLHLHNVLPATGPDFTAFASRRSVVYSTRGMVACSQPLAAEAGLEILRAGGNALDAAVAVSAVLGLTEPTSCGMGGDAFCLYYDAKTKEVKGLNGSGRSPKALTLAKARELGLNGNEIPFKNLNSVTVPGCAAAWCDSLEILGSGKITIGQALAPAIRLATDGVPISEITSTSWRRAEKDLLTLSPSGTEMLIKDPATGEFHAPAPGEVFKNPTLAATLQSVADHGKKGYYEGRIGQAIVDLIKSGGGVMTMEDLKSHTTTVIKPISYSYGGANGVTLHECPPNGQGITALIALGILDILEEDGIVNMGTAEHNGTVWLHTLIEVIRIAFADVRAYVADPEMAKVPVEELLSKPYLRIRAKLFDPKTANMNIKQGTPFSSSDTVLFTTSDSEGNACSFIQSNYAGFGTSSVPVGCGFTLQNRGSNFALDEESPNCIEGGKRPYHTIIPAMVTRGNQPGGDLFMTYGVMGGFMQPQGHVQVLMNMLHRNYHAQAALDAPRFCVSPPLPDNSDDPQEAGSSSGEAEVFLEEGISETVRDELRKMGHQAEILTGHARGLFGRGQIIQQLPGGVWAGGSDPRADGHAVPQI